MVFNMADFAIGTDETSIENLAASQQSDEAAGGAEFVLSSSPIVEQRAPFSNGDSTDFENLGELPRSYGGAFLFAIARDPHTLFAYWDVDWPEVFGDNPPADHKAHLRVLWHDGIEETTAAVEPMGGSHLIPVLHARSSYRLEIGYYAPNEIWNSVAMSDAVITPPDEAAENGPVDVATVPLHLSFQRIVDTFRGSKYDGDAIVEIVARLQQHADTSDASLPESERELLRALGSGLSATDAVQRSRLRKAPDTFFSRKRIESILGFGASSRM